MKQGHVAGVCSCIGSFFLLSRQPIFVMVVLARQKEPCNIKKKLRHHLEGTSVKYITVNEDYVYFMCLMLYAVVWKSNLITSYLVYFCNGKTKTNLVLNIWV